MTRALLRSPSWAGTALRQLAVLAPQDPHRLVLRGQVVEAHLPLVRYLAGRYRDLGEPFDDLVQVGTIGLIKAVDRFDPQRGTEFAAYATPTILGEIKRHFRDWAWAVRVPRRVKDLQQQLSLARTELTQSFGRAPTAAEIATRLGVAPEAVLEALEARQAYRTVPLENPLEWLDSGVALVDPAFADVVDRESLRPLLRRLADREKMILVLRFFRGLTQSEIAAELGISQMHVSRLLARTVAQLRRGLDETD